MTRTNPTTATGHLTLYPDQEPAPKLVDWAFLGIQKTAEVAQAAARTVAHRYPGVIEYDDLYQEALIILATSPDTVRAYGANLGRLYHWLWCDLTNLARRWATQRDREVSYELLRQGME